MGEFTLSSSYYLLNYLVPTRSFFLSHSLYANSLRTIELDGNYTHTAQYYGHKRCMQIHSTQSKLRPIPFVFPLFHILFQQL